MENMLLDMPGLLRGVLAMRMRTQVLKGESYISCCLTAGSAVGPSVYCCFATPINRSDFGVSWSGHC